MATLYRHSHVPRRRPRQGHRRGEICRRVQRRRPRPWQRRRIDHRQGPHRAHRRQRGACASQACIDVLTHRAPAADGRHRRGLQGRCGAGQARRSVRSTTTGSCSTASRSRWCWPRSGRSRASRHRWCGSNTSKKRTSPICTRSASKAVRRREARASRAAMPRRRLRRPTVRHEAEYCIPIEHHNPMELFASTAIWDGDGKLTVYDKTQGVQNVQRYLCGVFEMKPDDVRVMSPFMGGGFGSGLRPQYQVVLAVLAARALKRSVRLVLTRAADVWRSATGRRRSSASRSAPTPDGTLDAITHEAIAVTSQYEEFSRNETGWSSLLYKCANAKYAHKLARLDVPTSCDMRAPGAATGVYALECAMDELAVALKIDPLELRLRCYSDRDQNEDLPYTSKQLRECYRQGAEAFGWDKRNPRAALDARRQRAGRLGHGDRRLGSAADAGRGPHRADRQRPCGGRHARPPTSAPAPTRSWRRSRPTCSACRSTTSASSSATRRCRNRRSKADRGSRPRCAHAIATTAARGPQGAAAAGQADAGLAAGRRRRRTTSCWRTARSSASRTRAARCRSRTRCGTARSTASSRRRPTVSRKTSTHARNTHSAVFAEVKVDEQLGVIRVTRVVNAVAAGRILNPKTAHSQIMGGVVWGIGMALHEETLIDHRFGRVMNANIAEYHVPVNADVHDIKVIFVDEPDDDHQSARHQGRRRNRHRRRRGGDRQRGLSRHRKARARSADHAGQGDSVRLKPRVRVDPFRPRSPASPAPACRRPAPARHAARARWHHRSRPRRR